MSARNNEERLGVSHVDADPPLASEVMGEVQNPEIQPQPSQAQGLPLSFPMPTHIVDLPSQGRYYPPEHPLCGKDSLELRLMTAKDEDILTSKTLLKKGVAIDRLLQNLLIDKSINIDDMLVGDKSALLISARITGFGSEYEASVVCPECEEKGRSKFDLEKCVFYQGMSPEELQELNIVQTGDRTFSTILPVSQMTVEVRLSTGYDEKKITRELERKRKLKMPDSLSTDQLKSIIVSIEGHEDYNSISQAVDHMPSQDAHFIRKFYDLITPDVEMKLPFECTSCGYISEDMEVPLTVDFFWPR